MSVLYERERERERERESSMCVFYERESLIWRHCSNHLSEKAVFTINSFLLTVKASPDHTIFPMFSRKAS